MIEILWKKRITNRGGGTKYYVECPEFLHNDDKIHIDTLIRNKKHASILHAVMDEYAGTGKKKNFVIKIGASNKRIKEEYNISELLHKNHIYGFMKFICIFSCYDDIYDKEPKTTYDNDVTQKTEQKRYKICQGEHIPKNKKDVLIMPFVNDGSIEKFVWTENKIPLLKNLIIQTIMSLAVAFESVGFLHRDLHLGNILFKPTKIENIIFMLGVAEHNIPLLGKKIVITDFEGSNIGIENSGIGNYTFWDDLILLCSNVTHSLVSPKGFRLEWENDDIMSFLKNARKQQSECQKVVELIRPIINSTFIYHKVVLQKYNRLKP